MANPTRQTAAAPLRDFFTLLAESLRAFRKNGGLLLNLALPPALMQLVSTLWFPDQPQTAAQLIGAAVLAFGFAAASTLSTVAMYTALAELRDGQFPSAVALLRLGLRRFPLAFLASIAVGLLSIAGFLLLIIPGLLLYTWYAFVLPVIAIEGKGWSALGRSRQLSQGVRWGVLGRLLLFNLTVATAGLVAAGSSIMLPPAAQASMAAITVALLLPLSAAFTYHLYRNLCQRRGEWPAGRGSSMID